MAETTPQRCPYCRLKLGDYFTPREIGRMKPFCTNPNGHCSEVI